MIYMMSTFFLVKNKRMNLDYRASETGYRPYVFLDRNTSNQIRPTFSLQPVMTATSRSRSAPAGELFVPAPRNPRNKGTSTKPLRFCLKIFARRKAGGPAQSDRKDNR